MSESQNTAGLQWIADHEQKNPDLLHEMFDSPAVKTFRMSEIEQRAIRAEDLATKTSNDAAIAKDSAEKCAKLCANAQDYTRMCKSLNADIDRNAKRTRVYITVAVICCALSVAVQLFGWLWR